MIQVLKIGMIAGLLLVLVGGSVAILAKPADVPPDTGRGLSSEIRSTEARGGRQGASAGMEEGTELSRGGWRATDENAGNSVGGLGYGRAAGVAENISASPYGQGRGAGVVAATETHAWETLEGTVIVSDSELTVKNDQGDILVGLGQQWYREQAGFVVEVGDQVRIRGYYEDGEFKAGTVENLSLGTSITLRDETGRPMWSGRGNRQNQVSPQA